MTTSSSPYLKVVWYICRHHRFFSNSARDLNVIVEICERNFSVFFFLSYPWWLRKQAVLKQATKGLDNEDDVFWQRVQLLWQNLIKALLVWKFTTPFCHNSSSLQCIIIKLWIFFFERRHWNNFVTNKSFNEQNMTEILTSIHIVSKC